MPGFALPQRRIIADDPTIWAFLFWGAWSYRGGLMRLLIIRLPAYLFRTAIGLWVGCAVWGRLEGLLAAVERLTMQDPASGLLRIHLLRGWVNKGDEEGRSPLGPQPRFR